VVRLVLLLLSMLTANRPERPGLAWYGAEDAQGSRPAALRPAAGGSASGRAWPGEPGVPGEFDVPGEPGEAGQPGHAGPRGDPWRPAAWPPGPVRSANPEHLGMPGSRGTGQPGSRPRRRRIPLWLKWTGVLALAALIFRKVIASVVLMALSAALHLVGVNVHLPHIKFAWPWQTISAGSTTNTELGPWVLQRIEGISKPALGRVTFDFYFTHKVSKSIGFWPCWYSSTFYAVGYASATVLLNPGPAWWTPASGHYRLQILSNPVSGKPGQVAVTMVLPQPQLPQSVHDVTIDNIPSKPIDTQHSWTYPGFGCGVLLRPQFAESVLYAQAQQIAFYKSTHVQQVTRPLISTAQSEATQTIQNNFIQPTVNAFGYTLDRFTIRWAAP
jgi:hypothetical protein